MTLHLAPEPAGSTWARSLSYGARGLVRPRSVEQLQELVASESKVRALGSRHSFTDLADTTGLLVSLDAVPGRPELDGDLVRVPAAMRYGDLAVWLHHRGRALANLASLPHISVAGAVATGTHGSGVGNRSLAAAVAALELVDGRGRLLRVAAGEQDFDGLVVGLGATGIVTHLELQTEPAYDVVQVVHEGLTWPRLLEDLDDVLAPAYSVSIFTRWADDEVGAVWTKSRGAAATIAGAYPADGPRHVIAGLSPELTTQQMGVPGPWHERLPHFRLGFMPSSGEELQSELLLPRARSREALEAVRSLADALSPVLMVAEIRAVAQDNLWLSGAYGTDVLGLHFTWKPDLDGVRPVLGLLEERLLPLGARPHWGKLFCAGPTDLAPLYPRWDDFCSLVGRCDPEGKFRNAWLERTLNLG